MTLGDVTVCLYSTDGNWRDITALCADAEWTTEDPGGYGQARVELAVPLANPEPWLDAYSRMRITDGCTAAVLFEGLVQDPGRSSGAGGQVWSLAALGAAATLRDDAAPRVYVDRQLAHFDSRIPDESIVAGTAVEPETNVSDEPSLRFSVARGTNLAVSDSFGRRYLAIYQAGQRVARVDWSQIAGKDAVDYALDARLNVGLYGSTAIADSSVQFFTTNTVQVGVISSDWVSGTAYDVLDLLVQSTYVGATPDDAVWAEVSEFAVRATLYDKSGSLQTGSSTYSTSVVYDYEVVADLLGSGMLPLLDGANATIATTGADPISQLAYVGPVTPQRILDDLLALDQTRTYGVWERNPSTGKYRFEWAIRPTAVAHELDANVDQLTISGSTAELYNAVAVRWKDGAGRTQTTTRTQTVAALDALGVTRTATLDIGEDLGVGTAATAAGDAFLADHAYPTRGGSITVSRPVLHMTESRVRQPRELVAGVLVRVRNVAPTLAADIDSTTPDGSVVWRVKRTTYSTRTRAATLELGQFERTVERVIADTAKALDNRRRT